VHARKDHREDRVDSYAGAVTSTEDVLAPLREDQVDVVFGFNAGGP